MDGVNQSAKKTHTHTKLSLLLELECIATLFQANSS